MITTAPSLRALAFILFPLLVWLTFLPHSGFAQNKKKKPDAATTQEIPKEELVPKEFVLGGQLAFMVYFVWSYFSRVNKNIKKGKRGTRLKSFDPKVIVQYLVLGMFVLLPGLYVFLYDKSLGELRVLFGLACLFGGVALAVYSLETRKRSLTYGVPLLFGLYVVAVLIP
jgi:drug/metabolite transporter (DMT)-like permease